MKDGADNSVNRQLRAAREEARVTLRQLADLIGSDPSTIARIERDNYRGHSLSLLRRVAAALGKKVVVSLEDVEPEKGQPKKA